MENKLRLAEFVSSFVGERETDGENRSPFIDQVNRWMGVPLGSSYCLSAQIWCIDQFCQQHGLQRPIKKFSSVLAFATIYEKQIKSYPEVGDLVLWQFGEKYIGHAGMVVKIVDDEHFRTVEFNTSSGIGIDRNGNGCYLRTRDVKDSSKFKLLGFVSVCD